ncbi:class I SAM-dependent methyltransferase [Luteimonas mephitis]|uniref:class I SAM-dependent methyltransferase n=1 Tax=Luteimonas mephitis TaxID=83615 RepID=UPI003A8FA84D
MQNEVRQPHAVLDLPSRSWKAEKIARLLGLSTRKQPIRLLEIGTGSGGIAHWFAHHPQLRCEVVAVDVCDNRQLHEGYAFQQVEGVDLPFEEASFDVVISNHVIEHVGDAQAQARHLSEIRRVMKPDGVGYLAVPNRWMLTEPHYRLKFLSWRPRGWRTPYLKLMGKGDFYDCEPLEMRQLERMLAASGLAGCNLCVEGLRATFDIERPGRISARLLAMIPDVLLRLLNPINPTLIYRIWCSDEKCGCQVD